ncbi:MAG: VanZ family protein [Candidatus Accumulibacter sp.]|nr:VanZ family protein [Accumulibacter sp.]
MTSAVSDQRLPEEKSPPAAPTRLPLYLTLAYVVLIIYASLYPFKPWRDFGVSPLAFLEAPWPRFWTGFDLGINIAAYVPLGFLLALALRQVMGRWSAALLGLVLGSLLSFCLECLQSWLPSRVPSNVDLGCNALGATLGAMVAAYAGKRIFRRIVQLQREALAPIPYAEFGLVLLGIWLLTQLSPETVLFGAGDLRSVFGLTPAVPYAAPSFFVLETGVIACNSLAIGLFARTLLNDRRMPYRTLAMFMFLGLFIRTMGAAVLVTPQDALSWLTPGARLGLLIGGLLLWLMLLLPATLRVTLAGAALMAGTTLVNLTPPNPYSEAALAAWRQGHFLNFNGLTRWMASLWPFVTLPYLIALGRRL